MEKKDFVGIMLKDLSELKFNKAYKVLFAILGCALPMLPLIFFYGQHWFKRYELTGTLIIILIINAMLLMGSASIFIYARFKKSRRMVKKVEKNNNDLSKKVKLIIGEYEIIKCKMRMVANKVANKEKAEIVKKEMTKLEKEMQENEKELTKLEKEQKNIDEEITKLEKDFEKDFNTESVINYGVKIALVLNVVIGLFVVFLKVLDVIFNICFFKCDFRGVIIVVVIQFVVWNLMCAWWVLRGKV